MKFFAAAALAAIIVCAVPPVAVAGSTTELSVSGSGNITLAPNLATVDAAVETNAAAVSDAISENNRRYDRVVAALSKLGIARSDIALSSYAINYNPKPQVEPSPSNGERYGYTVSRSFAVKVRRIAEAGSVVDTCTSAGATGINGVNFGLADADANAARERATVLAVADARERADVLARAAHMHVVSIKSFDLGGGPVAPQPMMRMAGNAAPTQFDQSNVSVTVSVDAVFIAEP